MKIYSAVIVSFLLVSVSSFFTFTYQYKTADFREVDQIQYPTYDLGLLVIDSEVTIQLKVNATISNSYIFDIYIINSLTGPAGLLLDIETSPDGSILRSRSKIAITQFHRIQVAIDCSCEEAYLFIYSISAYVKVGTTTPTISTIFQDFVDVARSRVLRYVYIKTPRIINVSITQEQPVVLRRLQLGIFDSSDILKKITNYEFVTSQQAILDGNTLYYSQYLTTGYYGFRFRPKETAQIVTVTHQTDSYPCPFPQNWKDLYGTFSGCYHNSSSPNTPVFPCVTLTNGTCTRCYYGYAFFNSLCIYNPCSDDEYYLNLSCIKASPSCLIFNRFTGVCLTCVNSNYTLNNGQCLVKACLPESNNKNNTCVSNYCNGFLPISGNCTSCINNAFQLKDGACTPVRCFLANQYFSLSGQFCKVYPSYCSSLNFVTEKCLSCLIPFTINATTNLCELICRIPQVKVPGLDQCVNLPDNCLQINRFRHCIDCKPSYTLIAGICSPPGAIIIQNP